MHLVLSYELARSWTPNPFVRNGLVPSWSIKTGNVVIGE
jgi:hypothetical protein